MHIWHTRITIFFFLGWIFLIISLLRVFMNYIGKCAFVVGMILFSSLHAMEERAIDSTSKVINDTEEYLLSIINDSELEIRPNALKITSSYGYCVVQNAAFKSFFTGTSGRADLSAYIAHILSLRNEGNPYDNRQLQDVRANVAGHYKIHLMPNAKGQCTKMIQTILSDENDIKDNIEKFKLISPVITFDGFWKNPIEYLEKSADGNAKLGIPPMIVLYCARGKDKAQRTVDALYRSFGNQSGIGIAPRFSEKLTGLIFYTQDNSNEKVEKQAVELNEKGKPICSLYNCEKRMPKSYKILFPNPIFNEGKTLYHENFVSKEKAEDYHLSLPSLKKADAKKEELKKEEEATKKKKTTKKKKKADRKTEK